MSYSFWVPSLGSPNAAAAHCTAQDFGDLAEEALATCVANWGDKAQKAATEASAFKAIDAALVLVQSGIVGDTFRVCISGHANPTPGAPEGNWANDTCTINLQAVKA